MEIRFYLSVFVARWYLDLLSLGAVGLGETVLATRRQEQCNAHEGAHYADYDLVAEIYE